MQTPVPTSKSGSQKPRVIYFEDLTTLPVTNDLEKTVKSANLRRMTLQEVRAAVAADEYDVALLPAPEALRIPGVSIVPSSAVSIHGPSRLFMVFSKVVPTEIQRILVDKDDFGTGLLAQTLFAKKLMVRPEFVKSEISLDPSQYDLSGRDNFDAYVLAGKNAMSVRKDAFTFPWDLTMAWYEYAKLPYVLHVWVAKRGSRLGRLDKEIGDAARRNEGSTDVSNRSADRFGVSQSGTKTIYERAVKTQFDANTVTSLRRYMQELQQARVATFPAMTVYTEPVVRRAVGA